MRWVGASRGPWSAVAALSFTLSLTAACGGGVSSSPDAAAGAGGNAEANAAAGGAEAAGAPSRAGQADCECPPGDYFVTAEGTWSGQRVVTLRFDGPGPDGGTLDCGRQVVRGTLPSCSGPPILTFAANNDAADSIEVKANGVTYGDGEDYGYGELVPTNLDLSVPGVISGRYTSALEVPYIGSGGAAPGAEQIEISGTFRLCRVGSPICR